MLMNFVFSILPAIICLLGAIILFMSSKNQLSKRYLSFFLLLSFVNYLTHAAYFNHQYELFAFLDNLWIFTSLAAYPLFYYYIRLLTVDEKINWKWSYILYPAVLLSIFSFVLYFAMSPSFKEAYVYGVMYQKDAYDINTIFIIKLQIIKNTLFKIIFIIQVPLYAFWGCRMLRNFDHKMKNFYSTIGHKNMSKVRWVLLAFVFASIVSITSSAVGKDFFINKPNLLIIPAITHSLFLVAIITVGYFQDFTIIEYNKDAALVQSQDIDKAEQPPEQNKDCENVTKQCLEDLLQSKKIFTNLHLRITDVAQLLGTNRTYVSRIVNEEMKTNFCDLINRYRINYAKELMDNPENKHLSLHDIAISSGFASISSFYRVFTEMEKKSPGKYREIKG